MKCAMPEDGLKSRRRPVSAAILHMNDGYLKPSHMSAAITNIYAPTCKLG